MDINSTLDFFGGSIFIEEYRGNFVEIERRLLSLDQLSELENTSSDAAARKIFLRAVYYMLIGNIAEARTLLGTVSSLYSALSDLPSRWSLRCSAYSAFFDYIRRYPPSIRFRPELGGPTATVRTMVLEYPDTVNGFDQVITSFSDLRNTVDYWEALSMQSLLSHPLRLWTVCFTQHPAYPFGRWSTDLGALDAMLSAGIEHIKKLRDISDGLGLIRLGHYFHLLLVELYFGKSDPHGSIMLQELQSRYRSCADTHGIALSKMLEADNMLSPSFSSPVALNLVPIDSDDAGPTNVTWDNVESNLRLEDSAAAQSLYTEALDLIDEATSPRLRSAIILRQGCIAHIQACTSSLSSSLKSRFLEEADNKLAEASRLFQGDQTNTQIVRGHQILLRITRGDVSRVQQDAADIGRWGLETKNEGISQFVGLLMIRFGRRQWIDRSRFDVASHCYRCARACFLRLKDQIATFQALASELELHQSISDFIAARSLLDDQLPLFREVIAQIDAFAEQAQDPRTYFILRKNMLTTYGSLVSNVLRNSDVRMLSEWRVELDNYNNCPAMIEAMNEAVEDPYIQQNLLTDPTLQGDYGSVFEGEQPDQALYDQYHAVNAKYQENLENSDIHSAEGILHSFIQIAATANASSYVRYLIRIYAHFQLGETDKARALFDAIADSEVFDDRVKDDATSNVS